MFEPVTSSWWSSLGRLREGSPAGASLSVEVGFQFHSPAFPVVLSASGSEGSQVPALAAVPVCYGFSPEWTPQTISPSRPFLF